MVGSIGTGYGVPKEWLSDVKKATADTLLALTDHLPAEASEALLELATGGKPRAPLPVVVAGNPFDHPDAQRRFRMMANVEELARALDQTPARPRRTFSEQAAVKKKPAQSPDSPVKKKFEDKVAPQPAPDSPKPWRQRRSAAERKADGSYKPRQRPPKPRM